MDREQIELLAPAGSYDSFRAAMQAGADAVYMGGSKFGARAYADNPQQDSLLQALREAHLRGKKIYLTVNTLLKERELKMELYDYLRPYYEEGLDAVIVQDVGVLSFIREYFPDLPAVSYTHLDVYKRQERYFSGDEFSVDEIRAALRFNIDDCSLCLLYTSRCV